MAFEVIKRLMAILAFVQSLAGGGTKAADHYRMM